MQSSPHTNDDTVYAETVADARRLLEATTWERIRDLIVEMTPDGSGASYARRVIERRVINELRRALAFLLGEAD